MLINNNMRNMKHSFRKAIAAIALIPVLFLVLLTGCKAPPKPNVVFILTDQWRASAFGYAGDPNVKTPNIDQLAKESVSFVNAVSVCPVCTPYRAALLTGRFPTTTGLIMNDIYLPSEELCMAEIYKSAGYQTAYLGKWHLDGHGRTNNVEPERRQGFDYWKALECSHRYNNMPYYENDIPDMKYWEDYSPNSITKDAAEYLSDHANDGQPFLLFVSIATPHFPHHSAPDEYKQLYPPSEVKLNPNVPEEIHEKVYKEIQGYYAHCTATDKAIGELLNRMRELDLMNNTVIVFTSDHGEMMGGHGRSPYRKQLAWDESLNVPFLISYPGIGQNEGAIVNAPINTPDILPSLLGLCDIDIPGSIEGEDLSGLISAPDPEVDRAALVMAVSPIAGNYKDPEYRGIKTAEYTYTRTPEGDIMLFNDLKDPYQMKNLADMPEFSGIQADLEEQLHMKLTEIGDANFKTRDYYMEKWAYVMDMDCKCLGYKSWDRGEGVVQTPKK